MRHETLPAEQRAYECVSCGKMFQPYKDEDGDIEKWHCQKCMADMQAHVEWERDNFD